MIIAEFADKYDLPPARVHRSVRSLAREALKQRHGVDPKRESDLDLEKYALDVVLDQGVRVTTSRGSTQFSYEVVDGRVLYDWLRSKYGQDLLSENEVTQLMEYVKYLLLLAKKEGIRPEDNLDLRTESGKTLTLTWKHITKMERILWRGGWIEEKTLGSR